ncbi:hypothetical protein MiSe_38530 [Microseira wollei NIES-4236]|uniref:Uncharacterized protein n=1 Tax=Microseira wollei NIES-4236 TaxID=2530354 RepID=A0AAV3X8C1_9CYAN|nr:hypothetical protein MiSe_38530 [Microseira wollei NIES-4236]
MNNALQLTYQTRPEINFHSYSSSPLKWTKKQSSVFLKGLLLKALGF